MTHAAYLRVPPQLRGYATCQVPIDDPSPQWPPPRPTMPFSTPFDPFVDIGHDNVFVFASASHFLSPPQPQLLPWLLRKQGPKMHVHADAIKSITNQHILFPFSWLELMGWLVNGVRVILIL